MGLEEVSEKLAIKSTGHRQHLEHNNPYSAAGVGNVFFQAKLTVGSANDPLEHEADAVADRVMRMPEQSFVQRKCASCEEEDKLQRKPITSFIQKKGTRGGSVASDAVSNKINASKGGGSSMDSHTQSFMQSRFGNDFSDVKIHTDGQAIQMNRDLNANAFTVGNDIYFNEGKYSPNSDSGKHLLAHELTHTVQQGSNIMRKPFDSRPTWASIPIDFEMISDPIERMEMMRTDYQVYIWKTTMERYAKGELNDLDLQNESLLKILIGLKRAEINDLMTKIKAFQIQRDLDIANNNVKDPDKKIAIATAKIIEWLEVRKEISTPMPDGATVTRDPFTQTIESYSVVLNNVTVHVLTDTSGHTGNDTGPSSNFGKNYSWRSRDSKVISALNDTTSGTAVPINPSSLEVTIQTRYKDKPDDSSAYGRGTTSDDKANNATTLRVHEGSHGTDYLKYIRNNPFPVDISKGVVGQVTVSQMRLIDAYISGITKDSCQETDQVGFTQDEYLKTAEGKRSGIKSCIP